MIGKTEIETLLTAHGRVAVAMVTKSQGSAPRDAEAMMLIHPGGTIGTVGGGTVEHRIIEQANALLQSGGQARELAFPLGPDLDQCCGGHMIILLGLAQPTGDLIWPGGPRFPEVQSKRAVIVYGAGHVGQAILRALAPLPFQVTLIDSRPTGQRQAEPHVVTPLPEAVAEEADPDAFHVVLTHSHAIDLEIVTTVLSGSFGFCGLIGSVTKRAVFERRLKERGFAPEILERLVCPIGLPMLKDKRPEVIAAAVAVQLLLRDQVLREQA